MILYIENSPEGSIIYQEKDTVRLTISNLSYVKKRCIQALFTYEGYLKAVQKKLDIKYKVPVCIDDLTMLIPTKRVRDYDNIWINYMSVDRVIESSEGIEIYFYGNRQIHLKISSKTLKRQIRDLERIRLVKVKHFHA